VGKGVGVPTFVFLVVFIAVLIHFERHQRDLQLVARLPEAALHAPVVCMSQARETSGPRVSSCRTCLQGILTRI